MKVGTRLWTTLAAAGLMALPLSTAAQSTSSTQSGQSSTPTQQSGQETTQPNGQSSSSSKSPVYYLEQARKDLDSLSSSFKSTDAGRDLEHHFRELRMAYERDAGTSSEGTEMSGTSGSSPTTGSNAPQSGSTEPGRMARTGDTWRTHYRQIEETLDSLKVPRSSAWMAAPDASGSTSGTSGSGSTTSGSSSTGSTSGTSGSGSPVPSSSANAASPNAADLAQLNQFRADIEMFYQSMASSSPINKDQDSASAAYGSAASPYSASGQSGPTTGGQAGTQTNPPTGTKMSGTTGATGTAGPPQSGTAGTATGTTGTGSTYGSGQSATATSGRTPDISGVSLTLDDIDRIVAH